MSYVVGTCSTNIYINNKYDCTVVSSAQFERKHSIQYTYTYMRVQIQIVTSTILYYEQPKWCIYPPCIAV